MVVAEEHGAVRHMAHRDRVGASECCQFHVTLLIGELASACTTEEHTLDGLQGLLVADGEGLGVEQSAA